MSTILRSAISNIKYYCCCCSFENRKPTKNGGVEYNPEDNFSDESEIPDAENNDISTFFPNQTSLHGQQPDVHINKVNNGPGIFRDDNTIDQENQETIILDKLNYGLNIPNLKDLVLKLIKSMLDLVNVWINRNIDQQEIHTANIEELTKQFNQGVAEGSHLNSEDLIKQCQSISFINSLKSIYNTYAPETTTGSKPREQKHETDLDKIVKKLDPALNNETTNNLLLEPVLAALLDYIEGIKSRNEELVEAAKNSIDQAFANAKNHNEQILRQKQTTSQSKVLASSLPEVEEEEYEENANLNEFCSYDFAAGEIRSLVANNNPNDQFFMKTGYMASLELQGFLKHVLTNTLLNVRTPNNNDFVEAFSKFHLSPCNQQTPHLNNNSDQQPLYNSDSSSNKRGKESTYWRRST